MATNNKTPGWTQIVNSITKETFGTVLRAGLISPVTSFPVHDSAAALQCTPCSAGHTVSTDTGAQHDGSFSAVEVPAPQWPEAS